MGVFRFRALPVICDFTWLTKPWNSLLGAFLTLERGLRHDVEAMEDSSFLLTISWPRRLPFERPISKIDR